ncbi:MAG: DUF1657 domain-containing protein [Bacillota bacterium]
MTVGSQVKQTLASLKSAHATLQTYALQSRDDESKTVFEEGVKITGEIIDGLEERLKTLEFEEPQYKGF